MKIVVVEPHADDAFLSLGWHLEHVWAEDEKTIITVYADTKRAKEATAYASSLGADSVVIGLEESRMDASGKIFPEPTIEKVILDLPSDMLLFPLGLQHPDHLRVAASRIPGSFRYLDTPYQTKKKLSDTLLAKTVGMRIVSMCFPPSSKWTRHKLFTSQSKFMYYNKWLLDSHLPEVVLEDA